MAPSSSYYVFRALALAGFVTQWVFMGYNGALVEWLTARLNGQFPNGSPVKASFTGVWALDFTLGLLVTFFGSIINLPQLPDIAPFLLMLDLVFILVVYNMMTLVEDRRNRKTGPLRFPALWQSLNNSFGAASVLPIYYDLMVGRQAKRPGQLAANQARAMPISAIYNILISLPVVVVPLMTTSQFRIQESIVIWFFGPFTAGLFQDLVSALMPSSNFSPRSSNPVKLAYWMVGVLSAVVHVGVAAYAVTDQTISWSRVYWPDHSVVQPGKQLLTEAAVLFTKYDFPVIYLSLFALGFYLLRNGNGAQANQPVGGPLLTLIAISVLFGPGAGLAWLLVRRETWHEGNSSKVKA